MKKLSNIFLIVLSTVVLAWFLPWLANFVLPTNTKASLVYFSPIDQKFVLSKSDDDHKQHYLELNADGSEYRTLTKSERDKLLPQVFYTLLAGKDELPDSVCGKEVSVKIFRENSWVFVNNPREINKVCAKVNMMMESMPERLELEDATEVFRMTGDGIEFVDMATNKVLPERSARFTKMMKEEGFSFPASTLAANITSKKPYDEGYLMADANHQLFHVKMQVGRPYVHRVDAAKGIDVKHVFVTENVDHRFLGVVTDADCNMYMLEASTYEMRKLPVKWNPETQRMVIMANVFNWMVNINDDAAVTSYAVDNNDFSLLGKYQEAIEKSRFEAVSKFIFPFTLSFTSTTDQFVMPRIGWPNGCTFLILNVVLVLAIAVVCRRCRKVAIFGGIGTLLFGIFAFIPLLLFINKK